MKFKSIKKLIIATGIVLPLLAHIAITFTYAYGGYDGQHCAGLLDATWECTETEYYIDWMFNTFTIISLFIYYLISLLVTSVILIVCSAYNKALNVQPSAASDAASGAR